MRRLFIWMLCVFAASLGTGCVHYHEDADDGSHVRVRAPFTDVHVDASEDDKDADVDVDIGAP